MRCQRRIERALEGARPHASGRGGDIGVVLLLALGVALIIHGAAGMAVHQDMQERTSVVVELYPTIAVLPFVTISGDPENEYLSDGLSEESLNRSTVVPELHVAARTFVVSLQRKGRRR